MRKWMTLGGGAVAVLAIPALAFGVVLEGHFAGHADHSSGVPGTYVPGESYMALMRLNTTQVNPWYPWNAAMEYTAVLETTVLSFTGGFFQMVLFAPGTVRVFEDDTTPASFTSPATFTDGTEVLTGDVQNMMGQRVDIFGLPYDITGQVVFTGGANHALLDTQCNDGLLMNDFVDFQIQSNPPGYEEAYDADWKCPEATGTGETTWGRVKSLYR